MRARNRTCTAIRCAAVILSALAMIHERSFAAEPAAADGQRGITLESLLLEMVDRDALAKWSEPTYVCKEASSFDRHKTNPADPATWHTNNDHEQFIRVEQHDGRQEWVIMEHEGPGALVRFWTPLNAASTIRFYFDGSTAPAIAVPFKQLLSGQSFVRPPLAFVSWNEADLRNQKKPDYRVPDMVGGDLYLPIPFAKSCKITLDQVPFYYVINYRAYAPGTSVQTFSMADFEAAKATVDRVNQALEAKPDLPADGLSKHGAVGPGEELVLELPAGPGAVRNVAVKIDPHDAPQVLRSTILQAAFDDQPTIWCPIGDFFGTGARLHPVEDRDRGVTADGKLTARWVMPHQRNARLSLKNAGTKPISLTLAATTSSWTWDERSLYFHANWRCQFDIATRPMSDWNYLNVQGQGVYVGDTLTVFSPAKEWYGEGDERIYVDGEKVPSHLGTGTEDYYGYAWGMPNYFNAPFISTPQRDSESREDWRGYTTTSRVRLLDGIPFRQSLQHDMEIWNWADTRMDYAVATFWYAKAGAKHNRDAQPLEAATPLRELAQPFKIPGAIECETAPIASQSPGLTIAVQDGGLKQGQWSGQRQLFVQATKDGEFVELQIPATAGKRYKVTLYGTKSFDYGRLRFSINGQAAGGKDFDAYDPEAIASGPIELGSFEPKDAKLLLRTEVVGSHPSARGSGRFFGLDAVVIEPE